MKNSILLKFLKIENNLNFHDDIIDYYNTNHFYIKQTNHLPKLKKITITHTSKTVLDDKNKLLSIYLTFLLISKNQSKIELIKARKGMASFGIQKFDIIGLKMTLFQIHKFLKQILPLTILLKNQNINSYNSSYNSLLTFKNIDKFYDLFENQFKNLNQFGCKIVLTTTAINQLYHILYLTLLNHRI